MNKKTGNIVKGAVVVAGIAAAGAALAHKPTRQKIVNGVKTAIDEVQKRASELSDKAEDNYEKTKRQIEDVSEKVSVKQA